MLQKLKIRLHRDEFLITPLSMVFSPVYIIRNGLYKALRQIAPTIKGHILDFGCGSKPYQSLFVNAESYIGVDIEVSGHDHENSQIDFYYDGKVLPFPDNSFDAVVSFEVFEHVFNIEEVLKEVRRVLRPGGIFLLSVPFAWDEHEIPYDFARYTSFGISYVLKSNGFKVNDVIKTTTYFLAVSQMLIAYLSQHAAPTRIKLRKIYQRVVIFPLTVLVLVLDYFMPKSYGYYCNNVVLSEKTSE